MEHGIQLNWYHGWTEIQASSFFVCIGHKGLIHPFIHPSIHPSIRIGGESIWVKLGQL